MFLATSGYNSMERAQYLLSKWACGCHVRVDRSYMLFNKYLAAFSAPISTPSHSRVAKIQISTIRGKPELRANVNKVYAHIQLYGAAWNSFFLHLSQYESGRISL